MPEDKAPKDAALGKTLVGRMTLGQLHNGSGAAPVGLPLVYIIPPPKPTPEKGAADDGADKSASSDESTSTNGSSVNAAEEALLTTLRDAKIKFLKVSAGVRNSSG